jgi:hypothetical protein
MQSERNETGFLDAIDQLDSAFLARYPVSASVLLKPNNFCFASVNQKRSVELCYLT